MNDDVLFSAQQPSAGPVAGAPGPSAAKRKFDEREDGQARCVSHQIVRIVEGASSEKGHDRRMIRQRADTTEPAAAAASSRSGPAHLQHCPDFKTAPFLDLLQFALQAAIPESLLTAIGGVLASHPEVFNFPNELPHFAKMKDGLASYPDGLRVTTKMAWIVVDPTARPGGRLVEGPVESAKPVGPRFVIGYPDPSMNIDENNTKVVSIGGKFHNLTTSLGYAVQTGTCPRHGLRVKSYSCCGEGTDRPVPHSIGLGKYDKTESMFKKWYAEERLSGAGAGGMLSNELTAKSSLLENAVSHPMICPDAQQDEQRCIKGALSAMSSSPAKVEQVEVRSINPPSAAGPACAAPTNQSEISAAAPKSGDVAQQTLPPPLSPIKKKHFQQRCESMWRDLGIFGASSQVAAEGSLRVQVDRDNVVKSMIMASTKLSRSDFFSSLYVESGAYHREPCETRGGFHDVWRPGICTAGHPVKSMSEAFSCFWEELPSFTTPTGVVLVSTHGNGLFLNDDEQVLGEDHGDKSRVASAAGDTEESLYFFEGLGRVILWAVIQRQPVPSSLANYFFIGQLTGVDVIRGEGKQRLPEDVLNCETLRLVPGLSWLIHGLSVPAILHSSVETSLELLSAGLFEDGDIITMDNREDKLRAALGEILLDKSIKLAAAVRRGFVLHGDCPVVSQGLLAFSNKERGHLVNGVEDIPGTVIAALVDLNLPSGDCKDSGSLHRAVLDENVAMLYKVLLSPSFASVTSQFLRAATGCFSAPIFDKTFRVKVRFQCHLPARAPAMYHPFERIVYLSTEAYASEGQLEWALRAGFQAGWG